jgi:hypothetical protein
MNRFQPMYAFALALILSLVASPMMAQVCAGVPLGTGQTALSLGVGFPSHAKSYGAGVTSKVTDAVALSAGYSMTKIDDFGFDLPKQHTFNAGAAYEIPLQAANTGPSVSLCPMAGASYTKWDETNVIGVPLGVGIGAAMPVAEGAATVNLYAAPQFIWQKASADGLGSESDTNFGFTSGANVLLSKVLFGAGFSKIGNADGMFSIRAGFVF